MADENSLVLVIKGQHRYKDGKWGVNWVLDKRNASNKRRKKLEVRKGSYGIRLVAYSYRQ